MAGSHDGPDPLVRGIIEERADFADTLEAVGPDAPTLCGPWTSGDVAAHVASLDRLAGAPTFVGRFVVSRLGLRLNEPAGAVPRARVSSLQGCAPPRPLLGNCTTSPGAASAGPAPVGQSDRAL
ncbi:MAG: maleylpyruvate isomerase N-terminal domain-containing protein [Acidimicrobiia bacterium]